MKHWVSERLHERLGKRFGEMLCQRLCEMLDPYMLQIYFRRASGRIQESLNLPQLPSPDEGLVFFRISFNLLRLIHRHRQVPGHSFKA